MSPCEPQGSGDVPQHVPKAAGMAPGCGQDKQWQKEQRGDSAPKPARVPHGQPSHIRESSARSSARRHTFPVSLHLCPLPTYQPVVSLSPWCVSAPPALVALGGSNPPPHFPPGRAHHSIPQRGTLSLRGWDQTQQGSHWGDCSGDKDPAMPVTSTWRALSPPNSCIPPEPVWQGPVQVPRKRHPGRAFPGHALLHSSAESTKSRNGFLEPSAPTVLLVPPKVTHGSQCQWCSPVSHPPSRDPAEGWEGKKEEAETSEK